LYLRYKCRVPDGSYNGRTLERAKLAEWLVVLASKFKLLVNAATARMFRPRSAAAASARRRRRRSDRVRLIAASNWTAAARTARFAGA